VDTVLLETQLSFRPRNVYTVFYVPVWFASMSSQAVTAVVNMTESVAMTLGYVRPFSSGRHPSSALLLFPSRLSWVLSQITQPFTPCTISTTSLDDVDVWLHLTEKRRGRTNVKV